ncbi:hypothetical protein RRSWK_07236 [Rhodopirellula sp. SWK7]|nr:hypothetical protein RRSWK_07236 [Rhodopirellula sp. SWK7]
MSPIRKAKKCNQPTNRSRLVSNSVGVSSAITVGRTTEGFDDTALNEASDA